MSFRWFDESQPQVQLTARRQAFYDKCAAEVEAHAPGSIEQMTRYWHAQLREVIDGQRDGVKVDTLGRDWNGTPFQAIYDALDDWNESRWFAGVLLMKSVIEHGGRFCAYKAEKESAIVYFKDNRFYTNLEKMRPRRV